MRKLEISESNSLAANYAVARRLDHSQTVNEIISAGRRMILDPNNPLSREGDVVLAVTDSENKIHMFYADSEGVPYSHDVVIDVEEAMRKLSHNIVRFALDGSGICLDDEGNKYRALNHRPL